MVVELIDNTWFRVHFFLSPLSLPFVWIRNFNNFKKLKYMVSELLAVEFASFPKLFVWIK